MIARIGRGLHFWLAVFLAAGLVVDGAVLVAHADDDDVCEIVDDDGSALTDGFCNDQAIVQLVPGQDIEAVNNDFDSETITGIAGQPAFLLSLPEGSDERAITAQLNGDQRVEWAELNYVDHAPEGRPQRFFLRGDTVPTPGTLDQAYAPRLIGISPSGACGTGAGARVAILDSGYDNSHPYFADARVVGQWDAFTNQDGAGNVDDIGNAEDDDGDGFVDEMTGHGTHVMGIVLQAAPDATVIPIRTLDSDGVGQAFFLARAIHYAMDQNAEVINLSLGSTADTRIVREAILAAIAADVFVAAAAGNNGGGEPREFPATQDGVFGVAATDRNDRAAEFTSTHASLSLSAPGLEIVSPFALDQPPATPLGSEYAIWSGTSMATPWVSGAAALLLAEHPSWNARQIAARLTETADPIAGPSAGMGSGRLDIGAALDCGSVDEEPEKDKKDKKKKKGKKGKKGKNKRRHRH
jgi:thermitase